MDQTNMQLVKVKLGKKDTLIIDFERKEADGTTTEGQETRQSPIHKDLKIAFEKLCIHFALMVGFVDFKSVKDIENPKVELFEDFKVTQYSIGGTDEHGVTLTGYKTLGNGKAFNYNTPFYLFDQAEESRYKFMDSLQKAIHVIESEVYQYLDGSKVGENPQGQLNFEEKNEDPQ